MVLFADSSQVRRLADDMARSPARVRAGASRVVAKAAYDTEGDAKDFCPVDTGKLKNSIGATIRELVAVVGPTANYGGYVEDGTSRQSPQPYMRPAFDRREPLFVRALEQIAEDPL